MPAGVLLAVVIDNVEVPDPVTDAGLKLPPAPLGRPETVRAVAEVNPF